MRRLRPLIAEGMFDFATPAWAPTEADSPRGIRWIPLDPNNKKGWAALHKVLPIMGPFEEDIAAGLKKGEKISMAAYRYPVVATLKDKSAADVYAFIKALDETYGLYKKTTAIMSRWSLQQSGHSRLDLPFHEGAVRNLKEKGICTAEDKAWNQARIKRLDALAAAEQGHAADDRIDQHLDREVDPEHRARVHEGDVIGVEGAAERRDAGAEHEAAQLVGARIDAECFRRLLVVAQRPPVIAGAGGQQVLPDRQRRDQHRADDQPIGPFVEELQHQHRILRGGRQDEPRPSGRARRWPKPRRKPPR